MAQITKAPDAFSLYQYSLDPDAGWGSWQTSGTATVGGSTGDQTAYRISHPGSSASACNLSVSAALYNTTVTGEQTVRFTCRAYSKDPTTGTGSAVATATWDAKVSSGWSDTHSFNLSGLGISGEIYLVLSSNSDAVRVRLTNPSATVTYAVSGLGMSVSPSAVTVGGSVKLSFSNRNGETVGVEFWYGSTRLHSASASADSITVSCPASWFTTAGVTATSMRVDVRASDGLGRSASGNFTLNKQQASNPTPTAPKSTSVSGEGNITFSWEVNETPGTQTVAELQWSTDNASWQDLGYVRGNGKSYVANFNMFPAGTVYWRVRTTNSAGVVSAWSAGVSFTVTYTALTVTATPATVYNGNPVTLKIGNVLSPNVVTVQLYAGATLLATVTADEDKSISLTTKAAWFDTAGVSAQTMRVDVRASDPLNRSASAYFTLSKFVASPPTPTAPKSTSVSGSSAIPFSWTVDESAAAQTKAELQWSTDGTNWAALATVNGSTKTWSAAAYKFRAGTVYWRIRTTNAFGVLSSWVSVSFSVSYAVLGIAATPSTVSMGGSVKLSFTNRLSRTLSLQYKSGSTVLDTGTASANSVTRTFPADWFLTAGATGSSLQVDVTASDDLGRTATVRVTMAKVPMTLSLSPSSLYVGSNVSVTVGDTVGRGYVLTFKYQSTELYTLTGTGDGTRSVSCPASWFTTAGVTGSSMRVDVVVTDDLGRSSSANFTLVNPQGSTVTPTAPKSTTVQGENEVSFAWTVSTDWGTQTKAELQWSRNNALWQSLATVDGVGTTWTAPAVSFPAGTVYWRARVTNSFGVLGPWSAGTSFTVAYSAESVAVPVNSPTSGTISAAVPETFAIELQASGPVYDPFTIASAQFFWRSGESGDYTSVDMTASGSTATVAIPAGTFPSGTLQWYATATDNTGAERSTGVYTLSALNAVVEAAPLSPVSTVESGSGPIVFRWSYGSLDGSAQTKAELQQSTDGTSWTALASVAGSDTSWSVPAGTFPAGTIYWRVRSANAAQEWGPWSAAVSFVCFSAPYVTGVRGSAAPFATITWQTEGQLAYELQIDGKSYGPYFGADVRSFTLTEPLAPGTHTVSVRAQNRYGLWSTWTSATFLTGNVTTSPFVIVAGRLSDGAGKSPEATVVASPVGPTSAIYITQQPRDIQTTAASKAIFRVYYDQGRNPGDDAVVQWQRRAPGGAWTDATSGSAIPAGAKSSALRIASLDARDGHQYRARLTNSVGTVYSRAATFRYLEPTQYNSPADTTPAYPDSGYFLVYRNWTLIGKTYQFVFTDRFALGSPTYLLRQALPGGYYRDSYAATLRDAINLDWPVIGLLSGGSWVRLRLSEQALRSQNFGVQRQVVYMQYAGTVYPEAEIGEHEQISASFDAAWLHSDAADARSFAAMLGKPVILKTPGGSMIVGVLDAYERRDPRFYRTYSCTLRQINWRDFVDES